ncbi:hypothetical protein B0H19DRAFT_1300263 [Mycena capillaripes]|nr:hypothetical protein B0H19DRAFT_1300263 [Mycena capillaripes]
MFNNPNYLQGSAIYDVCPNLDREILSHGMHEPPSGHNTFISDPDPSQFPLTCSRLTEVFSILAGELLILIRINTVYGWSRKTETVIGLVTTVISLLGGSKGLFGSTNIANCGPHRVNVPDVNVASVYVGLVIHKALDVFQDIEAADGPPKAHKVGLVAYFKASRVTLPIFHLCLRDAGTGAAGKSDSGCIGQPLCTIGIGRLKVPRPQLAAGDLLGGELTLSAHKYNDATWSEFQENSALDFQLRSGLRTRTSHDRRTMYETPPAAVPNAVNTQKYLP